MSGCPLISVGIPTFNRLAMLERAVNSVLAQDYPNLEVVISDNASTDGTRAWCEELAGRDSRVRYIRQPANRGAAANFEEVFHRSRGSQYMVLGDDDWLERSYLSCCSRVLVEDADVAVACGTPRMFLGDEYLHQGRKVNLLQASALQRVPMYLWQVAENVPFHGLMWKDVLDRLPPMPVTLGGDWLFVAWLAFVGKIRTLDETAINKSVAGATVDWASVVRAFGLPASAAKIPYFLLLGNTFRDIGWASPVYAPAGRIGRVWLACLAAIALLAKFSVWSAAVVAKRVWHRFTARPFPLRYS